MISGNLRFTVRDLSRSFSQQRTPGRPIFLRLVILIAAIGLVGFGVKAFLGGATVLGSDASLTLKDAPFGFKPVSVGSTTVASGGINLTTQTINLKDVNYGGDASGTATRAYGGGIYKLDVRATMPDPKNVAYEVWLTGAAGSVPINVMSGSKTSWSLTLSDTDKFSNYSGILITLQRNLNGVPEEHIMEGSF